MLQQHQCNSGYLTQRMQPIHPRTKPINYHKKDHDRCPRLCSWKHTYSRMAMRGVIVLIETDVSWIDKQQERVGPGMCWPVDQSSIWIECYIARDTCPQLLRFTFSFFTFLVVAYLVHMQLQPSKKEAVLSLDPMIDWYFPDETVFKRLIRFCSFAALVCLCDMRLVALASGAKHMRKVALVAALTPGLA